MHTDLVFELLRSRPELEAAQAGAADRRARLAPF